jgi:flagellar hook assembly protein FlgD
VIERGAHAAGEHAAMWDGRDESGMPAPAGLYFARLVAGSRTTASRLVVVR